MDERTTSTAAGEELGRLERKHYLRLLVALRDLLRAARHTRRQHWSGDGRECGCELCHELAPLIYLGRHFTNMLENYCDPVIFGVMEQSPRGRFKALLARVEARVAEIAAAAPGRPPGEAPPAPPAVPRGGYF